MKEELKGKNILVICGGPGSEREVSLRTGRAVYDSLLEGGYSGARMFVLDCRNARELFTYEPDICFIAVHGKYGEDGLLQGYLETVGVPYTGSGVYASAVAFDKHTTKILLDAHSIPTASFYLHDGGKARFLPCVVKPAREGSSVGVSIVKTTEEYDAAVKKACLCDDKVIVEKFIEGKELHVSVVDGQALPPIWIKPKSGFYDYDSKYTEGATEYLFEAGLSGEEMEFVKKIALDAYAALECSGVARVDMIYSHGVPFVLEVNTVPGMTKTSLLPKAAGKAGISFLSLVEIILMSALKNQRRNNAVSWTGLKQHYETKGECDV